MDGNELNTITEQLAKYYSSKLIPEKIKETEPAIKYRFFFYISSG
jgi:hypothetical protein